MKKPLEFWQLQRLSLSKKLILNFKQGQKALISDVESIFLICDYESFSDA